MVLNCLRKLFYHLEIDYIPLIDYKSEDIQISNQIIPIISIISSNNVKNEAKSATQFYLT